VGKHSVGEADDGDAAGFQNAVDFGEDGFGVLEILDGDGVQNCVEGLVGEGEELVLVEVLDEKVDEFGIFCEFCFVHAVSFDVGKFDIIGEMGNPATHHVEDAGVGVEAIAVEFGELLDEAVIDVGDEAGGVVEEAIVGFVLFGALGGVEEHGFDLIFTFLSLGLVWEMWDAGKVGQGSIFEILEFSYAAFN
jgi:hypothetical protein